MNTTTRKISLFLTIALALSSALILTSCNSKNVEKTEEGLVYYMGSEVDKTVFDSPENSLDIEKIYDSVNYSEEMLYGRYQLNDFENDLKDFSASAEYAELEYCNDYGDGDLVNESLSTLPVKIEAGVPNLYGHAIRVDRNYHWAYLTFATEDGHYKGVLCTFDVNGNNVKFTPVDSYKELKDENSKITGIQYKTGTDSLEYTFALKGPNLTISSGELSVSLKAYSFSDNTNNKDLSGYLANGSAVYDNIGWISAGVYAGGSSYSYMHDTEGQNIFGSAVKYAENGHLVVYWPETDDNGNEIKHVHQFVCFGTSYSITLVDNEHTYYYTESYVSKEIAALSDGMTSEEISSIGNMSESEIKEIAEKKSDLFDDLSKELEAKGIDVTLNRNTGEIAMDASVLFGGDSAVITEEGKELLTRFLSVYTSVIYNEKYDGFIAKTLVEGHTAPVAGSTYDSGLPLSVERADNVKNYCLSSNSVSDLSKLSATLESVGLSNSKPIFDSNGEIDMAACRRVSFRFIVNVNQ